MKTPEERDEDAAAFLILAVAVAIFIASAIFCAAA